MPSDRTRLALFDIRDDARLAQEFVEGMSAEEFEADRRTFHAVTRRLEIVSEACAALTRRRATDTAGERS